MLGQGKTAKVCLLSGVVVVSCYSCVGDPTARIRKRHHLGGIDPDGATNPAIVAEQNRELAEVGGNFELPGELPLPEWQTIKKREFAFIMVEYADVKCTSEGFACNP